MIDPEFTNLEQIVLSTVRPHKNPGETLHDPALFPYQRRFWDMILEMSPLREDVLTRVAAMLPKQPVLYPEHASLYGDFDCAGFVLYCLDKFVDTVEERGFQGNTVIAPKLAVPWKGIPYWKTDMLTDYGFQRVQEPGVVKPTFVFITVEDASFDYTHSAHMGIILGQFDSQIYIAHKPNMKYLPEIYPLQRTMDMYEDIPGCIYQPAGLEFWELEA
jgi:hypothetical protein